MLIKRPLMKIDHFPFYCNSVFFSSSLFFARFVFNQSDLNKNEFCVSFLCALFGFHLLESAANEHATPFDSKWNADEDATRAIWCIYYYDYLCASQLRKLFSPKKTKKWMEIVFFYPALLRARKRNVANHFDCSIEGKSTNGSECGMRANELEWIGLIDVFNTSNDCNHFTMDCASNR